MQKVCKFVTRSAQWYNALGSLTIKKTHLYCIINDIL